MGGTPGEGLVTMLRDRGVELDAGLTIAEVERTEREFGFRFPPDLREFLQAGLPVGPRFPDWRRASTEALRAWLRGPLEGILFDVEHNGSWLEDWGARPDELAEALAVATRLVEAAPVLIPVYSHRMIADRPHERGNPVFSVHQTDIIRYGVDLRDYLDREFPAREAVVGRSIPDDVRRIGFWADFVS